MLCLSFCLFKLKTAYEMLMSDCSSYVCSSDLRFCHNTCSQCKTRIDDTRKDSNVCSHLPRSSTEASYYVLHPVAEPFEAGVKGLATGIEFLRYMQIKN